MTSEQLAQLVKNRGLAKIRENDWKVLTTGFVLVWTAIGEAVDSAKSERLSTA